MNKINLSKHQFKIKWMFISNDMSNLENQSDFSNCHQFLKKNLNS